MRRATGLAALLALTAFPGGPALAEDHARHAIVNVAVFEPEAGIVLRDQTVLLDDGRITSVQSSGSDTVNAKRVIDGRGLTLLPGLINAHVHIQQLESPESALRDLLQRGVTTVRDLGGDIRPLRELNRRAEEEGLHIPRIHYSALIAGPAHLADPRTARAATGHAPGTAPWMRIVHPDDEVGTLVADAKATGATGLKLYASLHAAQLLALTAEAKTQGLQVWTHSVVFPTNAGTAIATRPTQLIHAKGLVSGEDIGLPDNFAEGIRDYMARRPFAELDPAGAPYGAMFAAMRTHGVGLEPALIADGDVALRDGRPLPPPMRAMRDWACRATGEAFRAGVSLGAGTDYGGEGDLLLMKLRRLHECGLPPAAVLTAATWNNAKALGIDDRVGRVAPGQAADLLLVEGDPLSDLDALARVRHVFKQGRLVRPAE